IRHNAHKYSVSAMCAVLQIPRSTYYYHAKERDNNNDIITKHVVQIFKDSRNIDGQRKNKEEVHKVGYQVSKRRIERNMKVEELVSKYTDHQFKQIIKQC